MPEPSVVVVTGAASGLGRACATRAIDDGHVVVGFDRSPEIEQLSVQLGLIAVLGDICAAHDRDRVVDAVRSHPGRLAGMVNAAGVSPFAGPLTEIPTASWELTYAVNVTGLFELVRGCLPLFTTGGSIVNIASTGTRQAVHRVGAYGSSKSAVLQLTRQLAYELGERQIHVNAISPGITDTPMATGYLDDSERRAAVESEIPLGRVGHPDDVAACSSFLLSADSAYITGAEIVVDGGWTL